MREALLGLTAAVLLMAVVGMGTTVLSLFLDSEEPAFLALGHVGTLLFQVGLLLIAAWFVWSRGGSLGSLTLGGLRPSVISGSVVGSYAILMVYNGVIGVLGLELLRPSSQLPEGFFQNTWLLAFLGFTVVITAPLVEEAFFRGFLFPGLRNSFGLWAAALSSGFVFSLAHLNLGAVIPFTLIGAILALAYHRTGSLLTPISIHFVFNAISFSILVLVPSSR